MKWFVYVIMMGMYPDGTQDTYLYTEPTHSTLDECQSWVYYNSSVIRSDMMIEFNGKPIERVFCIEEQKFKQYLELQQGDQV